MENSEGAYGVSIEHSNDKHGKRVGVGDRIRVLAIDERILAPLPENEVQELESFIGGNGTFGDFFEGANIHQNAHMIKGVVCGHRVEDIEDKLMQKLRYMDKLVDELARGKKMESILRK